VSDINAVEVDRIVSQKRCLTPNGRLEKRTSAMADGSRRFPPPWHADPMPGGYVVRDANGQALAFVYSRDSDAQV
jgi:hypothetical protein